MRRTEYATDLLRLGAFVKMRRRSLELTQEELALRIGWSQERISQIERARYGTPSLPMLALLANALEVPREDILVAAGYLDASPRTRQVKLLAEKMGISSGDRQIRTDGVIDQVERLQRSVEDTYLQVETVDTLRGTMRQARQQLEDAAAALRRVVAP